MASSPPPIENLLTIFWNGGYQCDVLPGFVFQASNLVFGSNPLYQVSDFLTVYPKFGIQPQGVVGLGVGSAAGAGYVVNDVVTIVQLDAQGATAKVTSVGAGGAVTGLQLITAGGGYSVASGLAVTGGTGTGLTVNITAVTSGTFVLPQAVVQMYINLASASLAQVRWLDYWFVGMSLFVAHFCTLYLRSEGNVGSSAGAIANSGLAKGITISKSAGDVSLGAKPLLDDLEGFASWAETTYGAQLATFARVVGMGPSYAW